MAGNVALLAVGVQLPSPDAAARALCRHRARPVARTRLPDRALRPDRPRRRLLILWDLTRPPGAPGKGIALGIAAGVKLTPAVFVASGAQGPATGSGHRPGGLRRDRSPGSARPSRRERRLLDPGGSTRPAASAKVWIVDNQSLQGLIARALGDPAPGLLWAVPALAVAATGLWLARRARTDRQGVLVTALTALLISPISWSHHWVWCVPLIAVLYAERGPRAAAATAGVRSRALWLVPHQGDLDLRLPWWQQPFASPYPLLGLVLLAQLSARSSSAVDDPVGVPLLSQEPLPMGGEVLVDGVAGDDGVEVRLVAVGLRAQHAAEALGLLLARAEGARHLDGDGRLRQVDGSATFDTTSTLISPSRKASNSFSRCALLVSPLMTGAFKCSPSSSSWSMY